VHTLVELLIDLKALATGDDPKKLERITKLFDDRRNPAEFQVGRYYVADLLVPSVLAQASHLDPKERRNAIKTAKLVFPRGAASRVIRHVIRDPNQGVRAAARRAASELGLSAPVPTDVRYERDDGRIGGFITMGWSFGMFANDTTTSRKPTKASRASALEQHGLPRLANAAAIAKLVGVEVDDLAKLMRPGVASGSGYVEFEIPKAKGGTRRIAAPRAPLRKVQRILLDKILGRVPVHEACHGFVKGRSTVTNARPHEGSALVVKLDLKDFFPTVHYRRVKGLFEMLGYNSTVAATLAGLTTYRQKLDDGTVLWPGVLPQGAPTSPALANLACLRLDRRLDALAKKCGATYTRYADDLTFSFKAAPEVRVGRFLWWIDGICQQEGFLERPDKRRILRNKHQQRVTGIVVNQGVHVPRADRMKFRAILHNCKKHGVASQARDHEDFEAYLRGYAAYVAMVEPALGKRLVETVEQLLGGARG